MYWQSKIISIVCAYLKSLKSDELGTGRAPHPECMLAQAHAQMRFIILIDKSFCSVNTDA